MSTMPSESIDVNQEFDRLCRCGIRAAWHLSLLWGALVSLLSWTGGAAAATIVLRGLVSFLAFGLVGWGVNAVMVQAGQQSDDACQEADAAGEPDKQAEGASDGDAAAGRPSADGRQPDIGAVARGPADPSAEAASDASDYLAEAAS